MHNIIISFLRSEEFFTKLQTSRRVRGNFISFPLFYGKEKEEGYEEEEKGDEKAQEVIVAAYKSPRFSEQRARCLFILCASSDKFFDMLSV